MIANRPISLYLAAVSAVVNVVVVVFGVNLTAEQIGILNAGFAAILALVVGVQTNSPQKMAEMTQRLLRR